MRGDAFNVTQFALAPAKDGGILTGDGGMVKQG
jgi:hypothetical protein